MGNRIGAILVSANGDHYPFTSKLDFDCTNNMTKYEACIMGIRAAIEHKIKVLEVYGGSALVVYQPKGEWETRDPKLINYRRLVLELIEEFDDITFCYLPRDENQMADALATLAFMIRVNKQEDVKPIQMSIYEAPVHCYNIEKEEKDDHPWTFKRLASDYLLDGEILYKIRKDQVLLRCVDAVEAKKILEEVHQGIYGTHANDVIGTISLKVSNGHQFIFVVIDYFSKWVKVTSYANVTKSVVNKFLKKEIICRYGMPERIISDNALNLNNSTIAEVCSQFKIRHHNSPPYHPKMNGAVEAANKNIKKIMGKTKTYKDWHEKLPFALYVYRTSVKTSIEATPFSLVYGMEAVLTIEFEIPSL
ncbi:RNA-directed DNA polymerase (Reverse transcriptase), Ribonuclease H [Gossypium australe]|uniref:RNA-directed DNA polymerase (Reverse transcriptase), Ribonuclease H n=1 Tax=Gossypium australe TaxID=47621 RepID=A0A5B6VY90_9ROSI|nr:RNA-directed DNA polymerase (Reverse transcriptase), Ribonuclease H [Gossypium australe]